MSCCNECNECNETDPCLENCGCDIEVLSLACVRHDGSDLPCLGVVSGETLEAIIQKVENKLCELVPGLDGDDGDDGQSIDHTSFTGEPGTEGQPGQTSEYTVWGDAAETIVLGTFLVYNGVDGQGIDHVSFTSTDGSNPAAGSAGQTDTYTMWADALETVALGTFLVYNGKDGADIYDSGWIPMNDFDTENNFGLPAFSNGWSHPKIRVVGKTVWLEGFVMLPLSGDAVNGTTLLEDVGQYPDANRADVRMYSGNSGGYDIINKGIMRSQNPIMPQALTPSCEHLLSHFEMTYRPINDVNGDYELNLTTVLPDTKITTDGKIEITTVTKTNGDAFASAVTQNSPFLQLVSRVTRGLFAPNYLNFFTQHGAAGDERVSPASPAGYPDAFNGRETQDLGGFRVKLTTSYPLGDNITVTQIQQAIAQIQG